MLAQVVDLGLINQDGTATTSLVLKPTEYAPTKKDNLNARQKSLLHELHNALDKHGIEPTPDIKTKFIECPHREPKKIVHVDYWRNLAYKIIEIDSKRDAFNKCIKSMIDNNLIGFFDGYYWIIQ
jgi:hypothetical protein